MWDTGAEEKVLIVRTVCVCILVLFPSELCPTWTPEDLCTDAPLRVPAYVTLFVALRRVLCYDDIR